MARLSRRRRLVAAPIVAGAALLAPLVIGAAPAGAQDAGGVSSSDSGMSSGTSSDSGTSPDSGTSSDSGMGGIGSSDGMSGMGSDSGMGGIGSDSGLSGISSDSGLGSTDSGLGSTDSGPGTDTGLGSSDTGLGSTDSGLGTETGLGSTDTGLGADSGLGNPDTGLGSTDSGLGADTGLGSTDPGLGTDTGLGADTGLAETTPASDSLGTDAGSPDATGFEGSPEMGPAHADAVNTAADSYTGASANTTSAADSSDSLGAYAGSPDGTTGFEGSPEMGPAHAEAINTNDPTYTGEVDSTPTGFEGSPEIGPTHADAINSAAGTDASVETPSAPMSEGLGAYAGSADGTTGFEGSPEMGPAHAEAVNAADPSYTGEDDSTPTGFEGSPEMGPAHAQAVNASDPVYTGPAEIRTDGVPQGVELGLGSSLLGPLFGAQADMYMDWDRVQLSVFGGPYAGFYAGGVLRDPRPTGLSFEESASVAVGPGRVGGTFEVFDGGRAAVSAQASIGRFGYAARADLAPEAQAIDPQFTQSIPMPSAALGINARAGYRYTSEYDISPVTGPLRTGIGYVGDVWNGYVNAWNDLQEAIHGVRPDGPRR